MEAGAASTIRVRPHHLLCMLTYVGEGYSPAFVQNFDRLAARMSAGAPVMIVAGPDDICAPCHELPDTHCRFASVTRRDALAREALEGLLGPLAPGAVLTLTAERLTALRRAFRAGTVRAACQECPWTELCSRVAEGGYQGARVLPAADLLQS